MAIEAVGVAGRGGRVTGAERGGATSSLVGEITMTSSSRGASPPKAWYEETRGLKTKWIMNLRTFVYDIAAHIQRI